MTPLLVLGMFTTVFVTSDPRVMVNNKMLPVSALNKEDRVMMPLRAIFEALDATVDYDSSTKVISGNQNGKISR